ncbi:hypothetical protein GX50_00240 [[Emmonsia] crescens]|uniref:Uncharacterized protein n=1 Tax=[Emmonsia] crescens TaxID=73230 RepID=A0A2B7ZKG8_9EURO|nr:hypothetical protein GX50_00240 [Emmonsia crescens]
MPSDSKTGDSGAKGATGNSESHTKASTSNPSVPSRNQYAKQWWGSRKNFQLSYLLGLDPDGFEEGNKILDAMIQQDAEHMKGKRSN